MYAYLGGVLPGQAFGMKKNIMVTPVKLRTVTDMPPLCNNPPCMHCVLHDPSMWHAWFQVRALDKQECVVPSGISKMFSGHTRFEQG